MDPRASLSHLLPILLLACLIGSPRSSSSSPGAIVPKARYDTRTLRRYPAVAYRAIERTLRGAAAIAVSGRAGAFASGVLVARDKVLTARHVTWLHARVPGHPEPPRLEATALEVRFDYLQEADGRVASPRRFPVVRYIENDVGHDWILLVLGPDREGRLPAPDRVARRAAAPVRLGDPVYVVGFPRGGPMEVADDARVVYPHLVDVDGLERILAAAVPSERAAIRAAYRARPAGRIENTGPGRRPQPAIGIDSDTVAGMSGAGVYLKRSGRLVGILVDGAPDTGTPRAVSWRSHEVVLPLPAGLPR